MHIEGRAGSSEVNKLRNSRLARKQNLQGERGCRELLKIRASFFQDGGSGLVTRILLFMYALNSQ